VPDWWSYQLSDFLLFSPRAYWRMIELHNQALWPWQIPVLAAGAVALVLAWRRRPGAARTIAIALAVAWAFVGWRFFAQSYAAINWVAPYVAPVFVLQALLLILAGISGGVSWHHHRLRRATGVVLIAGALGYPLLSPLFGRAWSAAEPFGLAPDPTAIATLGFVLMVGGPAGVLLAPVPLLWCVAGGLTLLAMGDPQTVMPLGAALLATVVMDAARAAKSR
jgi:hypothetical protein